MKKSSIIAHFVIARFVIACFAVCLFALVPASAFSQSTNRARPKPAPQPPVSTAAVPSPSLREIGYRTIKAGETVNIADMAEGRTVARWSSSTPSAVRVDSEGNISGVRTGSGIITINETEYISVAVVPAEDFYAVPESEVVLLPANSSAGADAARDVTEYRTEPTFRLAYRFTSRGEEKGASGPNGGIDILGRGDNYQWLWTTFYQGGWFYDLNGERGVMVNGYQRAANGVELTLKPEFIYDQGVPYLQVRHVLHNPNGFAVRGQRFGASADVMMHQNDHAALKRTPYGAYMADSEDNPSLELRFVGEGAPGVTPVDTLWLGEWDEGAHVRHIYDDRRDDVFQADSAIGFSYQDIELAGGEAKEFIIRFTLARIKRQGQ